jgi:hypothetical protein
MLDSAKLITALGPEIEPADMGEKRRNSDLADQHLHRCHFVP